MLPGQAIALLVVNTVFPLLAVVSVALRLVARRRTKHKLDASDYFIFFTLLCAILNAITWIIGAAVCGVGRPIPSLPPYMQVRFLKVLYAYQIFYMGAVWGVKMSVVLFYRAIFGTYVRVMALLKWTLVVLTAWGIAFFFATVFQDSPVSANWTGVGSQVNWRIFYFVLSLTDVILDVSVLTIPIFGIRNLHMTRKKKQRVAVIFLMGAVIVIASTVRLVYVIIEDIQYRHDKSDFSFMIVNTVIWGSIEPCMSVIAACLPIIGATAIVKQAKGKGAYTPNSAPMVNAEGAHGVHRHGKVLDSIDLLELSVINSKSTSKSTRQATTPSTDT